MPNAVITGASQGIGKAIAEKLLVEGFSIAVCGRDLKKLNSVVNSWKSSYPDSKILFYKADLSKKADITDFASFVIANFSIIDILINNAGVFQPGSIADEPDNLLEELMQVNLYSAYYLTRKLLPVFKEQKNGLIVNMCSVASLKAYPNGGSYSISKYALLGFSENLREELKLFKIKVTSVCPGATYTPSWENSNVEPDRIMEANDIANMVVATYKLSPMANIDSIIMRPVKGDL